MSVVSTQHVTLNGTTIKNPKEINIERYKISTLERVSNGDMVGDYIARKRTFSFNYSEINAIELDKILNIIWFTDEMFYTLGWVENNIAYTATVYPGAIPQKQHKTSGVWIWKDVNFQLIEK